MRVCYFDAFSGMSGDMTVGALVDAGADGVALTEALDSMGLGASYRFERVRRGGISATKFHVDGGDSRTHRHLSHITRIIEAASLPQDVRKNAIAVFERLGAAESRTHGVPIEKVHFHEVGAIDSISDIVAACWALNALEIEQIQVSAINVGGGTVKTEHGVLPVPAPATAELLQGRPIYSVGPQMELTTPTGAALAVTLASQFGPMPPMKIQTSGYGAGSREFPEQPNVLRALIGETTTAREATTVAVLEANIDDASPQILAHAMDRLFDAGALDVTLSPLVMKKNRPGTLVRVIATPEDRERLSALLLRETTTIGMRIYSAERRVASRSFVEVETPHGTVRMKVTSDGFAPEYDDCRKLALEAGVPLKQIIAEATHAYVAEFGSGK